MRWSIIEDLGLDKLALGKEMAIALAVVYWQAPIDAMDVEFVLGSAAATLSERRRAYDTDPGFGVFPPPCDVDWPDFNKRSISIWGLDFDKATPI